MSFTELPSLSCPVNLSFHVQAYGINKISFTTVKNSNHYDVIIVGQAAAAFSAALYAGRYKMSTLIIGEEFGGETTTSNIIENYPGHPQIDGLDLMLDMRQQVEALEINIIDGQVDRMFRESDRITVEASDQSYQTGFVILAVGRERRRLELPREKELTGKGISYCDTFDGHLFRGKEFLILKRMFLPIQLQNKRCLKSPGNWVCPSS